VGCSAWLIHQRREIFGEDAEAYRPERWLVFGGNGREEGGEKAELEEQEQEEERRIKEMSGTMFQFGMGSRTCIGKNISLLEIYKLVPSLLRRFDIDFMDPSQEWQLINAWFVKQKNFQVKFSLRELVKPDHTAEG